MRYRARLVAKGFTQRQGVDYDETFAPVVRHSTLRLLVALSAQLDLCINHVNTNTAFLNGVLEETVFMKQPQGFEVPNKENMVCKLKKAIYGLKQSSRTWNKKIDIVLTSLGYKKSDLEPCLYIKKGKNNFLTIIALYVDDLFIFSINSIENECLKTEHGYKFKIRDLGEAKHCLGMRII